VVRSLLLATSFPPAVGGVETLLYQTNRRLAEPPLVVGPSAGAADITVQPIPTTLARRLVYRPTWFVHPALYYLAAWWGPALHAARQWRPQVIQVGHVYLAPLGWLLARRLRCPWLVYAYGQEVWRAGRPMGLGVADRVLRGRALAAADAVLVPGTFTAGLLADWGVCPERIVHVPFGAEPRPSATPPAGTSLLSVARLVPRKGIDTVIRALGRLDPTIEYRVVGSGPDEPRLRALAAAEGVAERVTFLGRLDDAALAREYQQCALFVLPARRTPDRQLEGYGLVYFEAAAWGRPVLAGRSGGEIDAVVDGQTGVLVDGASVNEVAAALDRLLGNKDQLRQMGEAGRRRVETTHNWSRAAAIVDQTLARLA
jgi:phosphatidylinositol alpha-1,6-mannosyltransferase